MKNIKANKIILIFLFIIFLGLMLYSYFTLPDKVAIHFSGGGVPNGWMSKLNYVISFGLLGILIPLFIIWIFHITPNLPKGLINLPNKEYWLAPDQFQQTKSDINIYGIWFADFLLFDVFIAGCIILNANKQSVVHSIPIQYTLLPLVLPLLWFFWKFLRRFRKPTKHLR
jgi:uncharacterized membrane protein